MANLNQIIVSGGSKYAAVKPQPAAKARLYLARGQAPVAFPIRRSWKQHDL